MSTDQKIPPLVDQTNETGPNERAAERVSVQDATDGLGKEPNAITGGSAGTTMTPRQDYRQFAYPTWPTSTPGPEATSPPPGQQPSPTRTDQMMYVESYDQERGKPGVNSPALEHRGSTKRPGRPDLPESLEGTHMNAPTTLLASLSPTHLLEGGRLHGDE